MYNVEELKHRYTGVSASFMNWYDISPLNAKQRLDRIIKDTPTKEQELGIQLHIYVLENNKFKDTYLYKSFDSPRGDKQKEFCELCSNMKITNPEFKALDIAVPCYKATYTSAKKSEEKIKEEALKLYSSMEKYIKYLAIKDNYKGVIDHNALKYIKEAYKVIREHEEASLLMFDDTNDLISNKDLFIKNEFRIYWEEPSVQVKNKPLVIKSIIDRLIIDFKNKEIYLIDLKTTNRLYEFNHKVKDNKYDRQLVLYWKAVKYFFEKEYPELNFNDFKLETRLVAVQTPNVYMTLPVECRVVKVTEETLDECKPALQQTLEDIAWHFETDYWLRKKEHKVNKHNYDILV